MATARPTRLPPLARNIKRFRAERGWTQSVLVKKSGVASIAMIEAGIRRNPRSENVVAIARALGVSVEDLFARPKAAARPTA